MDFAPGADQAHSNRVHRRIRYISATPDARRKTQCARFAARLVVGVSVRIDELVGGTLRNGLVTKAPAIFNVIDSLIDSSFV